MNNNEYPLSEQEYWKAVDDFVGGNSFIRILGPPVWLEEPVEVDCTCGLSTRYISSIGYESPKDSGGIVGGEPFFIGEGALYFFLCDSCLITTVISQST
jgi:hypothetical protein